MLEKGKVERLEGKPLFSSLLVLKNYSPEKRSLWLLDCFKNFGYPPISNADGNIYFLNAKDDVTALAFLTAQAVESVYNCLYSDNFKGCELIELCRLLNEQSEIIFDETLCLFTPWKKPYKSEQLCPFALVWKIWGFAEKEFER